MKLYQRGKLGGRSLKMNKHRKQVLVITALSALALTLIGSATVVIAARWNAQFTGGGQATVDQEEKKGPPVGTKITFGVNGKVDLLKARRDGDLVDDRGATILGHGTWVDHSEDPPRVFRLQTPTAYRCRPTGSRGTSSISGLGTDSGRPGEAVFIRMGTDDDPDTVCIRAHEGDPPTRDTKVYYKANAEVVHGQVIRHSCQLP